MKKYFLLFSFLFLFLPLFSFAYYSEALDGVTGVYNAVHKQLNDTSILYDPVNGSTASVFQNGFTFHSNLTGALNPTLKTLKLPICNNGGSGDFKVVVYSISSPFQQGDINAMTVVTTMSQVVAPVACGVGDPQANPAVFSISSAVSLSNGGWYDFVVVPTPVTDISTYISNYNTPIKWQASEGIGNGYILSLWFWSSYYGQGWRVGSDNCIFGNGTTNRTGGSCSGVSPLYALDFEISSTDALQNGQCGSSMFSCAIGTSVNNVTGTVSTWNCNGVNGGSIASCSFDSRPPAVGVCGSDHFYCVVGESTSFVGASTTAWIWECSGVGGATSTMCSEPFYSVIASSTVPTFLQPYEPVSCDLSSGSGFVGCLTNAGALLFYPSNGMIERFRSFTIMDKFPFSYVAQVKDIVNTFEASSTVSGTLGLSLPSSPEIPLYVPALAEEANASTHYRDVLGYFIWISGAILVYRLILKAI